MRPLILAMALLPLALATQSGPVPATESDPVLDAVRRYVAHWRSTLPDFICHQSTLRFSGSHSYHIWHPTDNQQVELTVVNGREQYQLHQTDNRGPIPVDFPPINSRGEYAPPCWSCLTLPPELNSIAGECRSESCKHLASYSLRWCWSGCRQQSRSPDRFL
jgi:hypothetical protein